MKRKCRHWVIAAIALHASLAGASETTVARIPGTGVTMTLPSSMQRGPVGTYFTEPSGRTFVQIIAGGKEHAADSSPLFRAIFPAEPKPIDRGRTKGLLYKRTRKENGGGWDGWSYNVLGQDSALNVSVMYTGSDSQWFDSFEHVLETLQWDERQLDSERSFQAHIAIPGLQLVPKQVGGLSFTADGSAGSAVPSFIVQVMPVTPTQASEVFPAICETGLTKVFGKGEFSGPHRFDGEGVAGCDGWGAATDGRTVYVASLRTTDGAVLSAIGNLAPGSSDFAKDLLRTALLRMKRLK